MRKYVQKMTFFTSVGWKRVSLKFIDKKCNVFNNLGMKNNFIKIRDENQNWCKL